MGKGLHATGRILVNEPRGTHFRVQGNPRGTQIIRSSYLEIVPENYMELDPRTHAFNSVTLPTLRKSNTRFLDTRVTYVPYAYASLPSSPLLIFDN